MRYFTEDELKCQHCGEHGMDENFMRVIESLREELGFPFVVTSGYRCPDHPIEAKKSSPGTHTTGRAIDIAVTDERALLLMAAAMTRGIRRIGVNQKGDRSSRFIHLDMADDRWPQPAIWSY